MEILQHPVLLFLAVILSLLSSYYLWVGLREKNVPNCLYGVGLGIPTIGMTDWHYWGVGLAVTALGWWLKNRLEL